MKWIKEDNVKIPIKSWCHPLEDGALEQAINLANHPVMFSHVALMPDAHVGYGMPIGGVIACDNVVVPNAVGVDIGCGMGAVQTNLSAKKLKDKKTIREILSYIKERVPVGEGHCHKKRQKWDGFGDYLESIGFDRDLEFFNIEGLPGWLSEKGFARDSKNLGSLGGGNHFIEIQEGDDGFVWMMLHSGSRNMGHRIASYYYTIAGELNKSYKIDLPDKELAYLPFDTKEGQDYIRDMNFALKYAKENRNRMMMVFKEAMSSFFSDIDFTKEVNIHHNYAALEDHFGKKLWIHRKGATSAKKGELGIIPGSMGTPSYIVEGLGNIQSFMSCSHGAGRVMGRMKASRSLTVEECDKAMEGIVFDWWKKMKNRGKMARKTGKKLTDLGEAPQAYKNIENVINSELDLIKPLVKLHPLGVIKG